MGAMYLDGVLQPDPLPCRLPPELVEAIGNRFVRPRRRRQGAKAEIGGLMDRVALGAVERMIDARARRYRNPEQLDRLQDGLSSLPPKGLIAFANLLLQAERRTSRRLGFGGENFEISLHAIRRLAEQSLLAQAEDAA